MTGYSVTYDALSHTATGTAKGVGDVNLGGLNLSGTTHTNAGTTLDTWTFTDATGNYNDTSGNVTDTIGKANAVVTLSNYSGTYDAQSHTGSVTITGVGGVPLAQSSDTETNAGHYATTASISGQQNYNDASGTATIDIAKAASTTVVTINGGPFSYIGTAITPAAVSVTGVGGLSLTPTVSYANNINAGTATASYSYAGDANHFGSSDSKTFTINKANAVVSITNYSGTYDAQSHTGSVTITGVGGVPLAQNSDTETNAGHYTTTASISGQQNYNDASGTATIDIAKANATISVTGYSVTYDALSHTATGTATGAGNVNLSGLNLTGTTHTFAGAYTDSWTFTDTTGNYNNASGTVADTIGKATPSITWANPAAITYGTALSGTQLNASANVAGSFLYNPAAGTVLAVGTQTLSTFFTPTDTTNYSTAPKSVQIVVNAGNSQVATTTSVSSSASTANYDQMVTFTAVVSPTSGSTQPTGTVTFWDGSTTIGNATLQVIGGVNKATFSTDILSVGAHMISASYAGTGSFAASTSISTGVTITVTSSTMPAAYVLNPTASGALTLSGNAQLVVAGIVDIASSSSKALLASGNAIVTGSIVQVHGGVSTSGNAHVSPTPITSTPAFTDPLANLPVPTASGTAVAVSVSGNSSQTINPGVYSSIKVSGNGNLRMNPGIYVIQGGGFSVSGNGNVTGNGVLIYNGGSGSTFGSVGLTGNGNISLSPMTTGDYAGILIFQARDNAKAITLSGNGIVMPGGTLYAPAAALGVSGNGHFKGSVIVDTITISGNSIFNQLTSDGKTVYSPEEVRTAYGVNNLALDGTGQTIAIVAAYDNPAIYEALDAFDLSFGAVANGPSLFAQYGAASSFLTVVNQYGQTTNLPSVDPTGVGIANWAMEQSLDVQWAHAIAPGAKIVLVEANSQSLSDLFASVATAASLPGVSVVSMSWGFTERQMISAQDEALYDTFLSHQGVTFVTSTGDYGTDNPEYPAFSPNVLAVGGTSLNLNGDGSYQGETGWGASSSSGNGIFYGSGGGLSQFEAAPSYQNAVQTTGFRTSPDVSMVADPSTGAWVADPYNISGDNPFVIVGGTSLAAPAWAGLILLTNQGRAALGKDTLNHTGPTETQSALYNLPLNAFHDITTGTNGGFHAGTGYDLVTGLGSPVADILVPALVNWDAGANTVSPHSVTVTGDGGYTGGQTSNANIGNIVNVFNARFIGAAGDHAATLQASNVLPSLSAQGFAALALAASSSRTVLSKPDDLFAESRFEMDSAWLAALEEFGAESHIPVRSDTWTSSKWGTLGMASIFDDEYAAAKDDDEAESHLLAAVEDFLSGSTVVRRRDRTTETSEDEEIL